jgi:hypothetical protein
MCLEMKNICTTVLIFFRPVFTCIDFLNTYTVLLSSNQYIPVHANTNKTNKYERLQQLFFIVFSLKIHPSGQEIKELVLQQLTDLALLLPADHHHCQRQKLQTNMVWFTLVLEIHKQCIDEHI